MLIAASNLTYSHNSTTLYGHRASAYSGFDLVLSWTNLSLEWLLISLCRVRGFSLRASHLLLFHLPCFSCRCCGCYVLLCSARVPGKGGIDHSKSLPRERVDEHCCKVVSPWTKGWESVRSLSLRKLTSMVMEVLGFLACSLRVRMGSRIYLRFFS